MRRALGLFGVRLAAVFSLAVSAALLVDYISRTPTFCGVGSGCAAVRGSGYGYITLFELPVPLPAFGLLGFALLLGIASTRRLVRFVPLVAAVGGVLGLGLFGVQALKIGQLCSLCVAVDTLSVIAAICGILQWRGVGDANEEFGLRWGAWPLLGVLAVLAPLAWPRLRPAAPVPEGVRKLYLPGKINVVEFADYECPFCRRLHPELKAVIASYPGLVNFARLNLPLKSHEFAHGAAQAQVCARAQGKGDEMADRLFAAEDLHPSSNRELAKELGVELGAYDRCISSGEADTIIAAESKILLDHGLQGLPTTYVGATTILGAQPEEVFRDAFDRAARGEGEQGIPALVYWPLMLALAAAISWVGRVRRATL
ncbi:MAG TPA: thioredoxin domain-containing protein [Polyangiaceae bacterium]|nr:thioredoxin domain-containing protein [Polyangiaceae bacterium]HYQ31283.1 thioredoxin domain-containing protein [Polyangiaceae bacterium]